MLWLTYAWKDNEDNDVDFIISQLQSHGIEVNFDRAHLLAGQRLWDQIDKGIGSLKTKAWAIYVTENSLRSEPCQEELSYALDRTLRSRGQNFPLIGIFPKKIDHELIPSALAVRKYVNLQDSNWIQEIINTLNGKIEKEKKSILPFGYRIQKFPNDNYLFEVWPRIGSWAPVICAVPDTDYENFNAPMIMPRGLTGGSSMTNVDQIILTEKTGTEYKGYRLNNRVNSDDSLHVIFSDIPERFVFGQQGDPKNIFCVSFYENYGNIEISLVP